MATSPLPSSVSSRSLSSEDPLDRPAVGGRKVSIESADVLDKGLKGTPRFRNTSTFKKTLLAVSLIAVVLIVASCLIFIPGAPLIALAAASVVKYTVTALGGTALLTAIVFIGMKCAHNCKVSQLDQHLRTVFSDCKSVKELKSQFKSLYAFALSLENDALALQSFILRYSELDPHLSDEELNGKIKKLVSICMRNQPNFYPAIAQAILLDDDLDLAVQVATTFDVEIELDSTTIPFKKVRHHTVALEWWTNHFLKQIDAKNLTEEDCAIIRLHPDPLMFANSVEYVPLLEVWVSAHDRNLSLLSDLPHAIILYLGPSHPVTQAWVRGVEDREDLPDRDEIASMDAATFAATATRLKRTLFYDQFLDMIDDPAPFNLASRDTGMPVDPVFLTDWAKARLRKDNPGPALRKIANGYQIYDTETQGSWALNVLAAPQSFEQELIARRINGIREYKRQIAALPFERLHELTNPILIADFLRAHLRGGVEEVVAGSVVPPDNWDHFKAQFARELKRGCINGGVALKSFSIDEVALDDLNEPQDGVAAFERLETRVTAFMNSSGHPDKVQQAMHYMQATGIQDAQALVQRFMPPGITGYNIRPLTIEGGQSYALTTLDEDPCVFAECIYTIDYRSEDGTVRYGRVSLRTIANLATGTTTNSFRVIQANEDAAPIVEGSDG